MITMYNRVFVTGDTHGDRTRLIRIINEYDLTQGDLLIVTGDFGYIMRNTFDEDEFLDSICNTQTCHIAFVLGNHEHYPRVFQHSRVVFRNGEAVKIRRNIFCLLNGEVYQVPTTKGEKKFFVMGGASSIDKGINPDRYAALWLKADKAKNEVMLIRSDDPAFNKATQSCKIINDRETCYRLADAVYTSLKDKVNKYMPDFAKEYEAVSKINRDTVRYTQALRIKLVLESLFTPCYKEAREEFYAAVIDALDKLGFAQKPVRFVLKEGTWFNEEIPSDRDYKNATENLKKHKMKVDFILSHTMPRNMILRFGAFPYCEDMELTGFLEWVMYECKHSMYYCGHWHEDRLLDKSFRMLFVDVEQIC